VEILHVSLLVVALVIVNMFETDMLVDSVFCCFVAHDHLVIRFQTVVTELLHETSINVNCGFLLHSRKLLVAQLDKIVDRIPGLPMHWS